MNDLINQNKNMYYLAIAILTFFLGVMIHDSYKALTTKEDKFELIITPEYTEKETVGLYYFIDNPNKTFEYKDGEFMEVKING